MAVPPVPPTWGLFPPREQERETWKHTESKTQGSHLPQRNKLWIRRNPKNQLQYVEGSEQKQQHSRRLDGGRMHDYSGVCAASGLSEGSGEGSGSQIIRSARESHVCASRTVWGWLPPAQSWSPSPSRRPPRAMRVAEMTEGADRGLTWDGCSRPCARLLFSSPTKCPRPPGLWEMTTQTARLRTPDGSCAPSSSSGGRGQAPACAAHTRVRVLKAWTGDLFAICLPAGRMAAGFPTGMVTGVWDTDPGREDRALLALWAR